MPRQAASTLSFVAILVALFIYATYLSYYGGISVKDAFAYQSAVVAAQRDSELLQVEQVEHHATAQALRPYEKLLASDLDRIDTIARTPDQRAPAFAFPATNADYDGLTRALLVREALGQNRFNASVEKNTRTRDFSNALFALLALLFVMFSSRLQRAVEEGRLLVERLQRAFISRRRDLPGVDVGSVLLSATRGSSVGGDTHDAFTLDRKTGMFLVADVSGKGIDAAVDTALIKYSIRTLFSEESDPGTILSKFARLYAKSVETLESFVVMFLAVVDLETGTVRYASAGHEPAWAVVDGKVMQLATTGPIVGIDEAATYGTGVVELRFGDSLVISTDGLTESRDARGDLLGADAVDVWLAEIRGSAQRVADTIVKRLQKRSKRITDDLAILVVRFAPTALAGAVDDAVETPELALGDVLR